MQISVNIENKAGLSKVIIVFLTNKMLSERLQWIAESIGTVILILKIQIILIG